MNTLLPFSLSLTALWLASASVAGSSLEQDSYSAPLRDNSRQLYWGDTHLHSTSSADAYTLGTRLSRESAYRFARGETITTEYGMPVRLRRPLDFLAVTDHAEYMGVFTLVENADARLKGWATGEHMASLMAADDDRGLVRFFGDIIQRNDASLRTPNELRTSIWEEAGRVADQWNAPGQFTTLIGYEWTSMITGDNLHRVVLYKDDNSKTSTALPFSSQDSTNPEDLWQALANYEASSGGEVLAIPHNGNVSNGRMFNPLRLNGEPISSSYAKARARWEPVVEVTQVKGDGETHPTLSPNDPFADFETWDDGNISLTADKTPDMLPYEYARSALREGLKHEQELGTNPFKFGMIGSSDMHTALSTTEEDNYFGKFVHDGPRPGRTELKMAAQLQTVWRLVSSGLAAVWADQNTRAGIFDAFKRREVYATTGTRIQLRMFAGWGFDQADLHSSQQADIGYARGVPMGGELPQAPSNAAAPTFMISAARDPLGANLDRVQVIKGWVDAQGESHEKIFNVALSDGRTPDENGVVSPVGNTVNLAEATWDNSIGAPVLETVWTDPEFDAAVAAFWYVRVLEIPTPRWTAYDAKYLGNRLDPADSGIIQERAYSSPVWYSPLNDDRESH